MTPEEYEILFGTTPTTGEFPVDAAPPQEVPPPNDRETSGSTFDAPPHLDRLHNPLAPISQETTVSEPYVPWDLTAPEQEPEDAKQSLPASKGVPISGRLLVVGRVLVAGAVLVAAVALVAGLLLRSNETPSQVESASVTASEPTATTPPIDTEVLGAVLNVEVSRARSQLIDALIIEEFSGFSAFEREVYTGDGLTDSDGDCQTDRQEVLIDQSLVEVTLDIDGCLVVGGLWVDPLDGTEYSDPGLVFTDTVIPLAAAHRAGAWEWDEGSKQAFAHDIFFTQAHITLGPDTNQLRGDLGPEQWRPPLESSWCRYAVDWIAVKHRWSLTFTEDEAIALHEMLDSCEPDFDAEEVPQAVPDALPRTTTSIPGVVEGAPGSSVLEAAPAQPLVGEATTSTINAAVPATVAPEADPATAATTTTATSATTAPSTTAAPEAPSSTESPFPRDCHANYSPCIENFPGDALDCDQIQHLVTIVGDQDPYNLDTDGDGFGCESFG